MRKVMIGVVTLAGLFLIGSTTDAKPKKAKGPRAVASAQPPSTPPSSGGSAAAEPAADGEWSLQDKQYWVALQAEMDEAVKRANDRCGSHFVGTFDKESFRGHLGEGGTYGMSTYARAHCAAGPSALEEICLTVNDDEATAKMSRDAVKAKVAKIECRWGGKGKQAITFGGKKLTTTIDIDGEDNASSLTTKVTSFMKQKL